MRKGELEILGIGRGKTAARLLAAAGIGALTLQLAGCAQRGGMPGGGAGQAVSVSDHEGKGKTGEYKDSDLDASWNEADSVVITCSGSEAMVEGAGAAVSDGVISITKEGVYVLRGSFKGQIQVNAAKEDKVRLVLDGFAVTCESSAAIYGIQSDKIIVTLAEGTANEIRDGSSYVFPSADEDEPDAAFFGKDDITINGSGSLVVEGNYQNGIRSKDDLKIISGTIQVTAVRDGVKGKDSVTVKDAALTIKSGEDGIKSNEDADPEKGYVVIDGGAITIEAGDDGIHGETWLTINDGNIQITQSYEGIEGRKVDINGGTIRVNSSDDGINAAFSASDGTGGEQEKMEADPDTYVRITGGDIFINASADGIDSNGDLIVEGGTVMINGPESGRDGALDSNGGAVINGGSFAAVGSAGMMQTFSQESKQRMIMVYYESKQEKGTAISLTAEDGNELLSIVPEKTYECVLISLPKLEDKATYRLSAGNQVLEITVDGVITQVGERTAGFGGFGGRRGGGPGQGESEQGEAGQDGPEQGMAGQGGRAGGRENALGGDAAGR